MAIQSANAELAKGYEIKTEGPNARLDLLFKQPLQYTHSYTDRGLLLKFDHHIAYIDLSDALSELSPWLHSIWVGYDTLLLKPNSNIKATFSDTDNILSVFFSEKNTALLNKRKVTNNSELAWGRAKALLALESGKPLEARRIISGMMKEDPENIQLINDLARIEEVSGRWWAALSLYEKANELKPGVSATTNASKRLRNTFGSKISAAAEYTEIDDLTISKFTLLDRTVFIKNHVLTMKYIRLHAKDKAIVNPLDGNLQPYNVARDNVTFTAEMPLNKGTQQISIFGGDKVWGTAWAYSKTNDYGTPSVDVSWNKPWYESSEAILGHGAKDNVMLGFRRALPDQLTVYSSFSLNQYKFDDIGVAAKSYRIQLGGRKTITPISKSLSVGYGLDLENINNRVRHTGSRGYSYFPFTLASREMQVADLGWSKKYQNNASLNARLGLEYDRQSNSRAPFAYIRTNYKVKPNLEWSFYIQTGMSSYLDQDESYAMIGGNIAYLFK